MDNGKQTLADMIIGVVVLSVLFSCLGMLWNGERWTFIFGIVIGAAASVLTAVHMFCTVSRSLDMEEEGAVNYAKRNAFIRMIILAVILVLIVLISGEFMALGTLIGMLSLKFSAYIQPLTHKFITKKIFDKGR